MSTTTNIGIIGAAGYTGGELLRILLRHPRVHIAFAHSRSSAGQPVYSIHEDLLGETSLHFSDTIDTGVDVIFLCTGHGESKKILADLNIPAHTRIIDLSQDFRLQAQAAFNGKNFVYGLPEFQKAAIQQAQYIANPGCFATAIQLALLPLAGQIALQNVHLTGITGATGAGQKLQSTSHFPWRSNNISAYKSLAHQHIAEITETLTSGGAKAEGELHFIPWRGDFARGIFVTAVVNTSLTLAEAMALYQSFYAEHPFTHVSEGTISMKQVANTNKCLLQLEQEGNHLVIHAAIDNLLKGASGQAVQNLNLMMGWPEDLGLQLKPLAF
jgi:N-acetyl-gamma-glutamyl-phosphate reductase